MLYCFNNIVMVSEKIRFFYNDIAVVLVRKIYDFEPSFICFLASV